MNMIKRYVVTAIDHDFNGNYHEKACTLGTFTSYIAAKDYVNKVMNEWAERNNSDGCGCDFKLMSAWYDDKYSAGREWNIEEVEIEL